MALSDRIQEIVQAGFTKAALAKAAGKTAAAVTHWLNGSSREIKSDSAAGIQKLTNYSAVWIATGEGPKFVDVANTSPVESRKKVPLISWIQAGSWGDVEDFFNVGEADEWVQTYDCTPTNNAFALRVEGDSMTNPNPEDISFPSGSLIIVDPNQQASAGHYVVAKDVQTQRATFKKLMHDGGRWFLKPLNPAYPTIEIDDPSIRVIGRVIESQIVRKL